MLCVVDRVFDGWRVADRISLIKVGFLKAESANFEIMRKIQG